MQNTIKGNLEKLGSMLRKAALYGYPINNSFSEVKIVEEEATSVYLDHTEIIRLYTIRI